MMSQPNGKPETVEDLERKKKKEEKAREKELKKLKAKEKAEMAQLTAQQTANTPQKSAKMNVKRDVGEENPDNFIYPDTPLGEKKKLSNQIAKQNNPSAVEKLWYALWEKFQFFVADAKSQKPPFVIVVVEKKIMRERHLTRHDIGRENFVAKVWKCEKEYAGTILKQLQQLGASLDWSRECFTMDDKRSRAVTEALVQLYKDGLIYRDLRLVNWDCILRTAISDIEVDYVDIKERTLLKVPGYEDPVEFGVLMSFAYPVEEGLGEIVVATTRGETMLGDTTVAVHPDDGRYCHLHEKYVIHPFNGRRLPIVCDAILVDPSFGTSAVKITPAHDPNDFEAGKRHNLEFINIFTDDGKINDNGGNQFVGMQRFKARQTVTEALKEKGFYRGAKHNEMRLGVCSRINDVMPLIKPQWYVNCNIMVKQALDAAMSEENKELENIPKQYEADWRRCSFIKSFFSSDRASVSLILGVIRRYDIEGKSVNL